MRVQIVSFHCVLKNNLGHLISSSFNQDVVTSPAPNEEAMLPALAEALKVLKKGQRRKIKLHAFEAYGFYNHELVTTVPRKKLVKGSTLKTGDTVQGNVDPSRGMQLYRVVAADSKTVTLDGNHPLAGQDLVFDIQMVSSHEEPDETLIVDNRLN